MQQEDNYQNILEDHQVDDHNIQFGHNVHEENQADQTVDDAPYGPMHPEDSFEYANRQLCYSLVHQSKLNLNQSLRIVYTDIISLTDMIREENLNKFENFDRRLLTALNNSNARTPHKWLQQAFRDLMLKLGENRSWRAYANIINALFLVIDVAKKYNSNDESTQSRIDIMVLRQTILIDLEEYLTNNFKDFITDCQGEYNDISHYYKYVKNHSNNSTDNNSIWPTLLIPALGAIGLFMFSKK